MPPAVRVHKAFSPDVAGLVLLVVSASLLVVVPPLVPSYIQSLLTEAVIFALLAMSLDLIYGYAGLISLGHAAFFGIGGYSLGLLTVRGGIESFWVAAPLAMLGTALAAAMFGIIALRGKGLYFILITFALGQLVFGLTQQLDFLTAGGAEGIAGIPLPDLGLLDFRWTQLHLYYFSLVLTLLGALVLRQVVRSPFGRALRGIRENEVRMEALGYHTWLYKYIAFILAGGFAGLAGVLFAYQNSLVTPAATGVLLSGLVVFMVIIGGAGTLYGAAAGAVMLVLLRFYASTQFPLRWPLIIGSVFVVSMLVFPSGIAVSGVQFWNRIVGRDGSATS